MADQISFTAGSTTITLSPVPGSVKAGGGHDDRGGGKLPGARAGYAMNGSCEVVLADAGTASLSSVSGLASGVGSGSVTVQGEGRYAGIAAYDALIDVTVQGDSVQTAAIAWKGSYNPSSN